MRFSDWFACWCGDIHLFGRKRHTSWLRCLRVNIREGVL